MEEFIEHVESKWIEEKELKAYWQTLKCMEEGCGGYLEWDKTTLLCNPPYYPHQCTVNPEHRTKLRKQYPCKTHRAYYVANGKKE